MPHTGLKVCSILLIIYGAVDVLAALAMLAVTFVGGLLGVNSVPGSAVSGFGWILSLGSLLFVLLYAGLAVVDLMAGINGLRFCGGSCGIKFCRIPAIIVVIPQAINCALHMLLYNDASGVVGSVVHIAIAVLCIVFAGKVEQYNLKYNMTGPSVEDMPLLI